LALAAEILQRAYASARTRWSDLELSPDAFRRHAERLNLDETRLAARADDLFLISAVLEGIPRAVVHLDECLERASAVTKRVDPSPHFIDDVKQEVRLALLTGATPKLRQYSGVGPFIDWLRVVAVRAALHLKRSDHLRPTRNPPQAVFSGQEGLQMKAAYLDDFHRALEAGFHHLSVRERTILRLHFINGLNIDRIGVMYGVHRGTVARWLVTIRGRLFDLAKVQLAAEHGLETADVRSLYRLLEPDLHVTMSRLLKDGVVNAG